MSDTTKISLDVTDYAQPIEQVLGLLKRFTAEAERADRVQKLFADGAKGSKIGQQYKEMVPQLQAARQKLDEFAQAYKHIQDLKALNFTKGMKEDLEALGIAKTQIKKTMKEVNEAQKLLAGEARLYFNKTIQGAMELDRFLQSSKASTQQIAGTFSNIQKQYGNNLNITKSLIAQQEKLVHLAQERLALEDKIANPRTSVKARAALREQITNIDAQQVALQGGLSASASRAVDHLANQVARRIHGIASTGITGDDDIAAKTRLNLERARLDLATSLKSTPHLNPIAFAEMMRSADPSKLAQAERLNPGAARAYKTITDESQGYTDKRNAEAYRQEQQARREEEHKLAAERKAAGEKQRAADKAAREEERAAAKKAAEEKKAAAAAQREADKAAKEQARADAKAARDAERAAAKALKDQEREDAKQKREAIKAQRAAERDARNESVSAARALRQQEREAEVAWKQGKTDQQTARLTQIGQQNLVEHLLDPKRYNLQQLNEIIHANRGVETAFARTNIPVEHYAATIERIRKLHVPTMQQFPQLTAAVAELGKATSVANQKTEAFTLSGHNLGRLVFARALTFGFYQMTTQMQIALRTSIDLSKRIAEIRTISQDLPQSTGKWAEQIRRVSDKYALGQVDVASSFYETLSNQVAKADKVGPLNEEIAQLATTTQASLTDAMNIMSSAINSFDQSTENAHSTAAMFFKTVDLGRVHLSDMANTFGRASASATLMGVPFEELLGLIAKLTINGVSFEAASTGIINVLNKLMKPTKEMSLLMKSWGANTAEEAVRMYGLTGILDKYYNSTQGNVTEIGATQGDIRAIRAVGGIFQKGGVAELKANISEINNAVSEYDTAIKETMNSSGMIVSRQMNQMHNQFIAFTSGVIDSIAALDKWYNLLGRGSKAEYSPNQGHHLSDLTPDLGKMLGALAGAHLLQAGINNIVFKQSDGDFLRDQASRLSLPRGGLGRPVMDLSAATVSAGEKFGYLLANTATILETFAAAVTLTSLAMKAWANRNQEVVEASDQTKNTSKYGYKALEDYQNKRKEANEKELKAAAEASSIKITAAETVVNTMKKYYDYEAKRQEEIINAHKGLIEQLKQYTMDKESSRREFEFSHYYEPGQAISAKERYLSEYATQIGERYASDPVQGNKSIQDWMSIGEGVRKEYQSTISDVDRALYLRNKAQFTGNSKYMDEAQGIIDQHGLTEVWTEQLPNEIRQRYAEFEAFMEKQVGALTGMAGGDPAKQGLDMLQNLNAQTEYWDEYLVEFRTVSENIDTMVKQGASWDEIAKYVSNLEGTQQDIATGLISLDTVVNLIDANAVAKEAKDAADEERQSIQKRQKEEGDIAGSFSQSGNQKKLLDDLRESAGEYPKFLPAASNPILDKLLMLPKEEIENPNGPYKEGIRAQALYKQYKDQLDVVQQKQAQLPLDANGGLPSSFDRNSPQMQDYLKSLGELGQIKGSLDAIVADTTLGREGALLHPLEASRQWYAGQQEFIEQTNKLNDQLVEAYNGIKEYNKPKPPVTSVKNDDGSVTYTAPAYNGLPERTQTIPAPEGYARGGTISGPPGIDRVPIWATAGEFVVNAQAAARHAGLLHHINAKGFADGGFVWNWPTAGGGRGGDYSNSIDNSRTSYAINLYGVQDSQTNARQIVDAIKRAEFRRTARF